MTHTLFYPANRGIFTHFVLPSTFLSHTCVLKCQSWKLYTHLFVPCKLRNYDTRHALTCKSWNFYTLCPSIYVFATHMCPKMPIVEIVHTPFRFILTGKLRHTRCSNLQIVELFHTLSFQMTIVELVHTLYRFMPIVES